MKGQLIRAGAFALFLLALELSAAARPAIADSFVVKITGATFNLGGGHTEVVNGTFDVNTHPSSISDIDLTATDGSTVNTWTSVACGLLILGADSICFKADGGDVFLRLVLPISMGEAGNLGTDSEFETFPHIITSPIPKLTSGTFTITPEGSSAPEPSSALLLATSLAGMLGLLRRKRQA